MTIPVLAASQFDPATGRSTLSLPEGLTLAEIVRHALPGATAMDLRRVRVALVSDAGASIIDPACWSSVRPKPGVQVVIRLVPGKGALRAVLSIVVAITAVALGTVFGPAVGGMLGLSGATAAAVGSAIVGMGVNLIGSLLVNALVPPVQPDQERQRASYAISGWRNRLDPDGAVPVVLGSLRYAPVFAARPYTEIVGDWQYIRSIFLFGEGPLQLSDYRIGETALSEFDEVEIDARGGRLDDLPVALYPRQVVEESIGVELTRPLPRDDLGDVAKIRVELPNPINPEAPPLVRWLDPEGIETPVIRTTGADARGASVILAFPAGLIRFNDEGKKRTQSVRIRIEQRLAGGSAWQLVTMLDVSGRKAESFYRQHTWSFAQRGRWEIRLTMMTDESDDSKVQSRTVWAALQTLRPEYPIAYDRPLSLVAVRVKATHQLSGALDNFSAVAGRVVADWDHVTGTWVARVSSNPASLFRAVLQHASNPKAVPNAGIDLAQLQEWHDFCRIKGLTYNRVLDRAGTSLREVLTEIAAAGRATPRHDGIRWGVIIDRPGGLVVDHITPRNSWGFSAHRVYAEKPHGLIVRFQDETNDWKETQRVIPRPGYAGPIELTEVLDMPGATDPAMVWREGYRRMLEAEYRPDVYEVTQDGAARVATRGDTVMLSHDVLSRVQVAARVIDRRGSMIVLDEDVIMHAGESYGLRFRRLSEADTVGTSNVKAVLTEPGETNLLTLDGPGASPEIGDLVMFGPSGQESLRVIVTQVEATEDMCSILRCVDAAPEIDILTDAMEVPAWSGRVGAEIAENLIAPPVPRFVHVASEPDAAGSAIAVEYLLAPGSGPIATASWEVDHRLSGGGWTMLAIPAANGGGRLTGYSPGQMIEIMARAISPAGIPGPWTPVVSHLVGSGGAGIPGALDPDSIGVTVLPGGARIEFSAGSDPNISRVQLYRSLISTLDRETDAVGTPVDVISGQAASISIGETSQPNLLQSGAWTAGDGWTMAGNVGTHAPGMAGSLSKPISPIAGRWYRIGYTISDRTAGGVTPQLTGGTTVLGTPRAAEGFFRDRLQAAAGNNRFALAAGAPFAGSVSGMIAYLETPACLAQGTHYLWLEPLSEDGLPGPLSGPFPVTIT